jgi:hypothetical protein
MGERIENAREFFLRFELKELLNRKIFQLVPHHGNKFPELRKDNLLHLITLMKENNIEKLVCAEENWYLDIDGNFRNPNSKEIREGNIRDLKNKGAVFQGMNPHINSYHKPITDREG